MVLCPLCKCTVLGSAGSIPCAQCSSLFHAGCANLSANELDLIESNKSTWQCEKCTQECPVSLCSELPNPEQNVKEVLPCVSDTTPSIMSMFKELCDHLQKVKEDQAEVLKIVSSNAVILKGQDVKLMVIEADLSIMRGKILKVQQENILLKYKLEESKKRMDQLKEEGIRNAVAMHSMAMTQQANPYQVALDVGAMLGVRLGAPSEGSSPSPQNPASGFQASVNPNSSNARPHLNYAFGGNPFTLHSSFPSSELRLAPSKFSSSFNSGTAMNSSSSVSLSKPVLRPPQLMGTSTPFSSSNAAASSIFQSKAGYTLNPSKLGNPFAKVSTESKVDEAMDTESGPSKEKDREVISKTGSESAIIVAPKFVPLGKKEAVDRTDLSSSSSSLSPAVSIQASPNSKPNSTESASPTSFVARASHSTISASPASTGFVFGQNLHERVEASPSESCSVGASPQVNGVNCSSEGSDNGPQVAVMTSFGANKEEKCHGAATNGDSEMLFSSVLKREPNLERLNNDGGEGSHSKSLSEAAREYEESRAVKRKYEEVTIITGEEDEDNVLQITCKLFAFNIEKSSWVERGRGQLRVNDKSDPEKNSKKQSRLVMRTQGSLRVVLNTKIWAGMSVVRASPKSIRMTAMDENQIRVFLLMASPADTDRLLNVLVGRVEAQKQLEEESKSIKEDSSSEPETCTIEIPSPAKKVCEAKENAVDMETEALKTKSGCEKELDSGEKQSNMIEEQQHSDREAST